MREAKSKYEQRISDHKNPKVFYKYVRARLTGLVNTPRVKDENGHLLDNCQAVANMFANNFYNVFLTEPPIGNLTVNLLLQQ